MDVLIQVALYGIGAAILIVVVLALIGFFSGLTFFARAYMDERWPQRSGHRAHVEPPNLIYSRSTATSNAVNETARYVAVERIIYPSRTFEKDTDRLIGRGAPFVVTVAAGLRKRAVVERQLPSMVHFYPIPGSLLSRFLDPLRTAELWACVGSATLDHGYAVTYNIAADIVIRFEPGPR
jgi:hypothetical protein